MNQVLLIDDDAAQLTIREAVLRMAGLQVLIATTAESALATLRTLASKIGLVVTDHIMPGCSGSEFVRRLRAENAWIPIIVLSGLPEASEEYDGLNVSFRQKPLPPNELIALVKSKLADAADRESGAA